MHRYTKKKLYWKKSTHPETNMTMEKQQFQDVPPIKNGDFPAGHVSLVEGNSMEI